MVFYQAAVPTGWTKVTSVNDRVLRVVSGTGGGTGGSWTISGVTVDGHALTLAELAAHNHEGGMWYPSDLINSQFGTESDGGEQSVGPNVLAQEIVTGSSRANTSTEGSGSPHSHGLTSDGVWRPAYINVIVGERQSYA